MQNISIIQKAIERGLATLESPEPLKLSDWADENFFLSAESSYVEGPWETLPFQKSIMDCISNDDVREITFRKSARVGYTKMILAAMGYFAEHKRRNQAIWQPTDEDADEFTKTELEPMIRDVPAVNAVFPDYDKKSKHNTLRQKVMIGSSLHIRGGKAAKNYRRLSVDVAYLDELDGFDRDVEREGDPRTLSGKRIEGATFPKQIMGSTPKIKGSSMIDDSAEQAEHKFKYHIPCPHCRKSAPLTWGGKDVQHGFKWVNNDPSKVAHLCGDCGSLFTQDQYLDVYSKGVWRTETGVWIDPECVFRDLKNKIIDTPLSVAFDLWTAYSPMTSWTQIVREFLAAKSDRNKLKTFINTTLGESWEEDDSEKLESENLYSRREHYLAQVPNEAVVLTAGIDTQDDRFEIQVDAWGPGEQRWSIDYTRLYGDPSRQMIWDKLAEHLRKSFIKEDGQKIEIKMACQDHGGHYSDEVNKFSKKMGVRFLIPVKGSSIYGKPVATFPRKRNSNGVYLTIIGTDTCKDLLYQRLLINTPGAGYWHWPVSDQFDGEYFKQLTAEERKPKWVQGVKRYVWDAKGRRNEPWDCSTYSTGAVRILQQHMGLNLETKSVRQEKQRVNTEESPDGWLDTNEDWM